MGFKIGTYNIYGLKGYPASESVKEIDVPGTEANTEYFTQVFSSLSCDVLGLQEGGPVNVFQEIAKRLKYNLATFPSPMAWPGHILSKISVSESRTFSHYNPDCELPLFSRTAGAVLLTDVKDRKLWVVDVHLHPSDVELRSREGTFLNSILEELKKYVSDIVVLGDFNSQIDEDVHGYLDSAGFVNAMVRAGGGIQATMDTSGIERHYIDHLYFSSDMAERLITAEVVRLPGFRLEGPQLEDVWVHSDHLPVVAELDWDFGKNK